MTTCSGRKIAALLCAAIVTVVASLAGAQEEPSWAPHERPDKKPTNAELEKSVIDELGLSTHDATQKYVAALCERLAPHASLGAQRVRCIVIDQALPNAFTLPSGAIYVSRGLLALAGSEAEVAGVLGHEIGHVTLQHAAAREAVIESLGPLAIGFAAAQYLAAFSREQESAADREGQQIASAAGFSPDGLPRFLRRLEVTDRLNFGASRIPGFFDTHPGNVARMADTADRAHNLHATLRPGVASDDAAFLAKLDGLTIGPNPSEGVFVGSRFLHPDLGFTVYFPDGWTLVNTPAAVGAIAPRRDARFALELAARGDDPVKTAKEFRANAGANLFTSIDNAQPIKVNGLAGYEMRGLARTPMGPLRGQLTWLAYSGRIYLLSAIARGFDDIYRGRAHNLVRSFRSMTDEERASITVLRLRVVRAHAGETLVALSRRVGNAADLPRTALVNGVAADAVLVDGQSVRVAVAEPYKATPPPAEVTPPRP